MNARRIALGLAERSGAGGTTSNPEAWNDLARFMDELGARYETG